MKKWHVKPGLCTVIAAFLLAGCSSRSKEQLREIEEIEQRVKQNPAAANLDDGNGTPLDVAVLNNYMELAEFLVEHGANVNARDRNNETPMHRAVISDRTRDHEMMRFLLRHGADVNATRNYDETPLHTAAYLGLKDTAAFLLEHGGNPNARSGRGETPLILASCPTGYPELVELLLRHGADVKGQQNNGATALHQAAMIGNVQVVEVLLQHGADPDATNVAGDTPLHYAAVFGQAGVAEHLLAHHAAPNALDVDGHTPLWKALHAPAVTATASGSSPVDTVLVASVLRQHGAIE